MKPKLYQLLSSLSQKELSKFLLFTRSPYFNTHKETPLLLEAIIPFHPDFELEEHDLFKCLYPEKPFEKKRLRVLRTYLLKLLDRFLIQEYLEGEILIKEEFLIKASIARKLYRQAEQITENSIKKLAPGPLTGFEEAAHLLELRELQFDLQLKTKSRTTTLDSQQLLASLDRYYLAKRMQFLSANETNATIFENKVNAKGIWETLSMVEKADILETPLVNLYYHLLYFLLHPLQSKHLDAIYAHLEAYHAQIPKPELLNIFMMLANRFITDHKNGVAGSLKKAFENYKRMQKLDILFGQGNTTIHLVRNAIALGASLKAFEWADAFLEEATKRLPPGRAIQTLHFCKAHIAYRQKKYSIAKEHLLSTSIEDPMEKLSADNLLLKCYFETQETEALFSLQQALRRYLNRHQELPEEIRKGYLNFLNFTGHLYDWYWKLKPGSHPEQLKQKLIQYEVFFNREWALEKLSPSGL